MARWSDAFRFLHTQLIGTLKSSQISRMFATPLAVPRGVRNKLAFRDEPRLLQSSSFIPHAPSGKSGGQFHCDACFRPEDPLRR